MKFHCLILLTLILGCNPALWSQSVKRPDSNNKAVYDVTRRGEFMKTWLVAGPVPVAANSLEPTETVQEKLFRETHFVIFDKPFSPTKIKGKQLKWELLSSIEDVVDLDKHYKGKDFVYAYAGAELKANKETTVILGLGSDDGVKVWLNGKPVHDSWTPRGIKPDNDLVPLQLVKGTNQLLLLVQDIKGGWGFTARLLDSAELNRKLSIAAGRDNIEQIRLLLKAGAAVNGTKDSGLPPLAAARLSGRDEVVQLLLKSGAVDRPMPSLDTLIGQYYTSLHGKETPGIAILLAKDGNILYEGGFGYADIKSKRLIDRDTKFRIGSVTKQFTAAAILKLQENNLLSVNDKLSRFIPGFPGGDEVTIHQLLTHTSGIHSYTNNSDFFDKVTKPITEDSLVAIIKKGTYDFSPGEHFLYNNSGYFLLGYIIEKLTGKSYGNYLKENFFEPLGMSNTGVHTSGTKLLNEAKGYAKKDQGFEEALNWDMSWAGGAGALYSTVEDLLKWNEALYNGKVISEKSLQAALTPVVLKNGEQPLSPYGYGLGFSKYRGIEMIGHGGGLHGFVSQLAYYPKEKLTVVMFSNTAEPEVNFNPNTIAEAYLWEKMDKQQVSVVAAETPKNLQRFRGRYELTGIGVITITTEESRLYAQLSGQPKFEIFPSSEYEFFWKVVEARLKFVQDTKGEITQAILYQNGAELTAKKLKEETIISLQPSVLTAYTGKFKFNDLVVTIRMENNRLYAQPAGQPQLELQALSETEFVIKEINARIRFVKEEDGSVKKFKLTQNGIESDVLKIE